MTRWLCLILLTGCSPPAPSHDGFDEAALFAAGVVPANVMQHVEDLATEHALDKKLSCSDYPPQTGLPSCDLSRDAAVTRVRETLESTGYDVESVVQGPPGDEAHNLVAELRGTRRPEEIVVVAAHLDAYFAGADDNSSGVAALLEIARLASEQRFTRTLRFVAFDLEERGSIGSTRYVESGLALGVVAVIVLECLGYADDTAGSQDSIPGLPLGDVGDFLAVVGNENSVRLAQRVLAINQEWDFMRLVGVIGGGDSIFPLTSALTRSDNGPFWLHGIPALMFTDTADLRNPNYHKPSDTAATLDPHFLGNATRVAAASAALFAEIELSEIELAEVEP